MFQPFCGLFMSDVLVCGHHYDFWYFDIEGWSFCFEILLVVLYLSIWKIIGYSGLIVLELADRNAGVTNFDCALRFGHRKQYLRLLDFFFLISGTD